VAEKGIGISYQGKRVVLHLNLGGRESTESWKGVLNNLVERGLRRPQLFITDGNPGLLKAIKDISISNHLSKTKKYRFYTVPCSNPLVAHIGSIPNFSLRRRI